MIAPRAIAEGAGGVGIEHDGPPARQADLPAVGMPAQHGIETRIGGVPVHFRGMGQ